MIPIKDDVPRRTLPVVNFLLIAVCAVVFVGQLFDSGDGRESLVERFGMVPVRMMHPQAEILVREAVPVRTTLGVRLVERDRPMETPPVSPWLTLLTSMFLHGGWLHFLGNMWFLYIFGDNIEDRFGHLGYLGFYLLAGLAAGGFHLVTNAGSTLPTIGASGAIAGVMGAYFFLYPRARVLAAVPIFFFIQLMVLPAVLFLGVWFVLQLLQGSLSMASVHAGGVAWWAHIGGFAFGVAAAWMLHRGGRLHPPPAAVVFEPRNLGPRMTRRY